MIGECCDHCNTKIFPPRDICPNCKKNAYTPYAFSGKGTIYSYTKVTNPPKEFGDQTPYAIALIKLDEGPLITAQLTDFEEKPEIGTPVEMVTRQLRSDGDRGPIIYGYKFRPQIKL